MSICSTTAGYNAQDISRPDGLLDYTKTIRGAFGCERTRLKINSHALRLGIFELNTAGLFILLTEQFKNVRVNVRKNNVFPN